MRAHAVLPASRGLFTGHTQEGNDEEEPEAFAPGSARDDPCHLVRELTEIATCGTWKREHVATLRKGGGITPKRGGDLTEMRSPLPRWYLYPWGMLPARGSRRNRRRYAWPPEIQVPISRRRLMIGKTLHSYRVLGKLGEGGMG